VIRLSSDHTAAIIEPTMLVLRAILLTALASVPCFATAGLAEWEIKTPGGNLISHVDPFIGANGTCLRGVRPEKIYVAHLEWWRYYRNAVVGKAKKGFFILNETSHAVSFLVSEAELNGAIAERQLGAPTAPQMTLDDGWRQVWEPLLLDRCKQLMIDGPQFQGVDEATKAAIKSVCQQISKSKVNRR
jgi:hypothetical protein